MSYQNAENLLPVELLEQIQEYVEGACIYIPKRAGEKAPWGSCTTIRKEFENRNREIYEAYLAGETPRQLAQGYFLSQKSIERILRQERAKGKLA